MTNSPIEILSKIARQAGEIIMQIYTNEAAFAQTEIKSDDSPLTLADTAANAHITQELQLHFPHIPIVSEEGKHLPYDLRKTWTEFWLVDPLDGTKEFLKRNGEFTVNIALIREGLPVLGVVYVPANGVLYAGEKGKFAYKETENQRIPLQAPQFSLTNSGVRVVASRSHLSEETKTLIEELDNPSFLSVGSSLKFMMIAEGKADYYPRLAPTMMWDTGAAQAVLEAAGGSVLDFDTKMPLRYDREDLLNPWFVAMGHLL